MLCVVYLAFIMARRATLCTSLPSRLPSTSSISLLMLLIIALRVPSVFTFRPKLTTNFLSVSIFSGSGLSWTR